MKITLTNAGEKNFITEHSATFISVNKVQYFNSLILTPEKVIDTWNYSDYLSLDSLGQLLEHQPEILLLGVGQEHPMINPKKLRPLIDKKCPYELMTTPAACRTFNILVSEGRQVVAGLLLRGDSDQNELGK